MQDRERCLALMQGAANGQQVQAVGEQGGWCV